MLTSRDLAQRSLWYWVWSRERGRGSHTPAVHHSYSGSIPGYERGGARFSAQRIRGVCAGWAGGPCRAGTGSQLACDAFVKKTLFPLTEYDISVIGMEMKKYDQIIAIHKTIPYCCGSYCGTRLCASHGKPVSTNPDG